MSNAADLKEQFTYTPPTPSQTAQVHEIYTPALILAQTIHKHCTPSAATDHAIHLIFTAVTIAQAQISAGPAEDEVEVVELEPVEEIHEEAAEENSNEDKEPSHDAATD